MTAKRDLCHCVSFAQVDNALCALARLDVLPVPAASLARPYSLSHNLVLDLDPEGALDFGCVLKEHLVLSSLGVRHCYGKPVLVLAHVSVVLDAAPVYPNLLGLVDQIAFVGKVYGDVVAHAAGSDLGLLLLFVPLRSVNYPPRFFVVGFQLDTVLLHNLAEFEALCPCVEVRRVRTCQDLVPVVGDDPIVASPVHVPASCGVR